MYSHIGIDMRKLRIFTIIGFLLSILLLNCTYKEPSSATSLSGATSRSPAAARIPFFPVRGNHEEKSDLSYIVNALLPAYEGKIYRMDNHSVNYFVDWKNVRIIVIDQFSEFSKRQNGGIFSWLTSDGGNINASGREWTESVINSAGPQIDHIFIAFHEPAFPRNRHVRHSFDRFPENRNQFWNMLVRNNDKVRAVLVAHTHYYSRMRIKNPLSVKDIGLPDQEDGVFQIDCGITGRKAYDNTIIEINIQGKNVRFRVIQAQNNRPFHLIDTWRIDVNAAPNDRDPEWSFAFIGDNRNGFSSFRKNLEEIRDMRVNPAPVFNFIEFVVDGGDMSPVQKNYEDVYLRVFGKSE